MVVWLAILVKLIMTTKAEAHVYRLQVEVETLKSQIEAMKSQIEAMKCCANCEHHDKALNHPPCGICKIAIHPRIEPVESKWKLSTSDVKVKTWE